MNPILILEAALAGLDLIGRLAQQQDFTPEQLEAYIVVRNKLRKELVRLATTEDTTDATDTPENTG